MDCRSKWCIESIPPKRKRVRRMYVFSVSFRRACNAVTKGYACKLPGGQRFVQSYFEFQIRISWKNKRRRMKSGERLNLKFTFRLKLKLVAINKVFSVASLTTDSSRILYEIGNPNLNRGRNIAPDAKFITIAQIFCSLFYFLFVLPCMIMITLDAAFLFIYISIHSKEIYI